MVRTLAAALCTLVFASCASSGWANRDDPAAAELSEVKARILELQRRAAVADVELARLRQKVAELEAELVVRRRVASPAPAASSPSSAPEPAAPAPAFPATGTIEEDDLAMDLPAEPIATAPAPGPPPAAQLPLTAPPTRPALPQSPAASAAPVTTAPATASATPTSPTALPPAAQALYDRGYTLFHQGQYAECETTFVRFLEAWSTTELADNAHYWIGESRLARSDSHGALAAFRAVVERYPDGNKVPDALFKIGQALESLGDAKGAAAAYEEVVRRFPEAPAADAARERRQKLGS